MHARMKFVAPWRWSCPVAENRRSGE